jgi:hypothetical protein
MLTSIKRAIFAAGFVAILAPQPALAQTSDQWQITVAPLYLWATKIDGELTAGSTTVPVFLNFADAFDNLGGAFSFHLEAHKGRWGVLSDLNFVRLSTGSQFTARGIAPGQPDRTIEGDFHLDNTIFEIGGSYLLSQSAMFAAIGGVRTYTVSEELQFSTPAAGITPIDASRTSVNAFVGFTYRPQIAEKFHFVSRADIGGGGAFTWTGMLGVEYRIKPVAGLILGYKAFGIDVSSNEDEPVREYDLTNYGPIFGLNLHWGGR